MKKTVRTDLAAVSLSAANHEQLEYELQISGDRANFAWVDANGAILTHMDFGAVSPIVWQLKAGLDASGSVILSVPQNAGYSRKEKTGASVRYVLTLGFVTAVAYTLTVKKLDTAGQAILTLTDIDFKMDQETDEAVQGLTVNL